MQVLVIRRPNPRSSLNGQSDPLDSMPMLGQLRRTDDVGEDVEYYRVRSFSITPNGIFNLGDSFRSRRSRSINSASSSGSSQSINSTPSHRERVPRQLGTAIWVPLTRRLRTGLCTTSQCSTKDGDEPPRVPRFKVAMLGASGVGKTALTCQFTTSEYICAYDTSLVGINTTNALANYATEAGI
uniref:Uncharacterized protein n=1 Tax=Timema shepardi TaxID=629360 RepID=A0A7R9AU15_TIMSH|nr:unnamed protein product [Timema shepardi]